MLERVEILESSRKELRRGVGLSCEIENDYWDEAIPHRLVDLSPSGGFVETLLPLAPDEELDVLFHPPRTKSLYWLRARVVRASFGRRCSRYDVPGMGIEFLDFTDGDRKGLAELLVGIPPRAPIARKTEPARSRLRSLGATPRTELVEVEELLVDQRTKRVVSDLIGEDVDAFAPRALAPMLY